MKRAGRFEEVAHGPKGQSARTLTASPTVFIGNRVAGRAGVDPGVLFHIHVDANRDGVVDDDWRSNDRWEWSRQGAGAIVLPYIHRDKPRIAEQIAPITLRRDPSTAGRSVAGWKGELSTDDPYQLTFLSDRTAAARPLTDPVRSRVVTLDLSRDEIELGMEATTHPGPWLGTGRDPDPRAQNPAWSFDGLVKLRLRLFDPAGALAHEETAVVRVAPWVASTHFDPTEVVYVTDYDLNTGILAGLGAAPQTFRTVKAPLGNGQWTQDQGEIGSASAPKDARSALTRPELIGLKDRVLAQFLRPDMTVLEAVGNTSAAAGEGSYTGDSINIGGNIECVPPFVHRDTNRVYAHGRVYYGAPVADAQFPSAHSPMYGALRRFFDKQAVQDPFTIDSGWLRVGHVDEVVSFLPMKDARLGFRVLIASPDLALRLLAPIPDATPAFGPHATLRERQNDWIVSAYFTHKEARTGKPSTLDEENALEASFRVDTGFLKGARPQNVHRYDFRASTPAIEKKLATIRDAFKREVGLDDTDFIPLPVLFAATTTAKAPRSLDAVAFTPGVVNGLAITRGEPTWSAQRTVTFLMPKPFGPARHAGGQAPSAGNDCVFEEHIRGALGPPAKTGVEVSFADDFEGYHVFDGEVHCGTNSLRTAPTDRRFWAPREDTRR